MAPVVPLKVVVRIRSSQPHDGAPAEPGAVLEAVDANSLLLKPPGGGASKTFSFDRVFGQETAQRDVFATCGQPLLDAVMEGRNSCLFAFGCTGAGKTYCMLGPDGGSGRRTHPESQDGVLPRAAAELFRRIARAEAELKQAKEDKRCSFEVRASFMEVYKESAFDLLKGPVSASRDPSSACLVREDKEGRVFALGAVEEKVSSAAQLLQLVAKGAAARATAATGVHAHSSRSHALLQLAVEQCWTEPGGDPAVRHRRTALLTLVDLAGAETMERSHGGYVDAAGVGTNLGLLVLGRVIRALAEDKGERVPFRDSTLTRLMQSSLSGGAVTTMLACVSPAVLDADGTATTLNYAMSASCVKLRPVEAKTVAEALTDPMLNDEEDTDLLLQRRTLWIETADFGHVFARAVGDPSDPLILYVHGSGPANSSMMWNDLALDVTRLAAAGALQSQEPCKVPAPRSFFHVAIDCPGYGRSPGDRQIIRSYPGQFLASVVQALGRKHAVALVGSSQGACAVLNCALEKPKLALALAVCHPVGHAPQRYGSIAQPTLLIFDVEDAGHPVSVGRQMRRHLPQPRYFEFARSKDGDWEVQHMGVELCAMLRDHWPRFKHRRAGQRDDRLPELARLAGGLKSWSQAFNGEWLPWCANAVKSPLETEYGGSYQEVLPVLVDRADAGSESSLDDEEWLERAAAAESERLTREAEQRSCDLCQQPLLEPTRLVKCRCALCACCFERTVRYIRRCPCCGSSVELEKSGLPASDAELLRQRLKERRPGSAQDGLKRQQALLDSLVLRRTRTSRLVLEYGCVSQPSTSTGKTSWTSFVRAVFAEGSAVGKGAIAKVDFNINPDFAKPTASLREGSDRRLGYAFEYTMARPYPCVMTVHFKQELGLPRLVLNFSVVAPTDGDPKEQVARRVIIELPTTAGALGKVAGAGGIRFEADPPRNGWVHCFPAGSQLALPSSQKSKASFEIEYLSEPGLPGFTTSWPPPEDVGRLVDVRRSRSTSSADRSLGSRASSRSSQSSDTPKRRAADFGL